MVRGLCFDRLTGLSLDELIISRTQEEGAVDKEGVNIFLLDVSGGKSERYTKGKFSAMGVRGLGTIKCAV
jgi:hypothetical protein